VLGAGGSIGTAVAKEFAAEGAEVFLAGHTKSNVEDLARQIMANGGRAHMAAIDALDDTAVEEYFDGIVKRAGRIDITFNAVGPPVTEYGNGNTRLT
jgi:3-oxoacyl-[acyl-carrier protein] reductase